MLDKIPGGGYFRTMAKYCCPKGVVMKRSQIMLKAALLAAIIGTASLFVSCQGLIDGIQGLLSGIEDTTWKSEEGVGELTLLLTNGKATFTTTVLGVSVASSGDYRISGNKITFSNFTGVLTSSVNNKEFDYRRDGDTLTLSQNGTEVYKFKKT